MADEFLLLSDGVSRLLLSDGSSFLLLSASSAGAAIPDPYPQILDFGREETSLYFRER